MSVDGGSFSFVGCGEGEHAVDDELLIALGVILVGLTEGGDDHLGFWGIEFLAEGVEEAAEIFFIHRGVSFVVAILVTLPPEESSDFISLSAGVVFLEIGEDFLGAVNVAVILHTGLPADGLGLGAFFPLQRGLSVSGVDHGLLVAFIVGLFVFVGRTSGSKNVPSETAVSDAAFEDENGLAVEVTHVMADADFRTDFAAADVEPSAFLNAATGATASHREDIADVLPLNPVTLVIGEEGVEVFLFDGIFECAVFVSGNLAEAEHVGLPHEDVDFYGLTHVGGLTVGVGQSVLSRREIGHSEAQSGEKRGDFGRFHKLFQFCR